MKGWLLLRTENLPIQQPQEWRIPASCNICNWDKIPDHSVGWEASSLNFLSPPPCTVSMLLICSFLDATHHAVVSTFRMYWECVNSIRHFGPKLSIYTSAINILVSSPSSNTSVIVPLCNYPLEWHQYFKYWNIHLVFRSHWSCFHFGSWKSYFTRKKEILQKRRKV